MSLDNTLLQQLKEMNADQLNDCVQHIMKLLKKETVNSSDERLTNCRNCESPYIVKYGKDKNGKQRYKCKCCDALFAPDSYSTFSNTHKSKEVWERYIYLMLQSATLEKCAQECGISVRTAFIWRHKILATLKKDQSNRVLSGIVETDDMFMSISYKGNHTKSKRFTMPRKPYQRGNDNTAASGGKACILYAVERNGQSYGEVLGVGPVNIPMLQYAFNNRIDEDAIAVFDGARNFKRYFENTKTSFVQTAAHSIPGNQSSPPQIKGAFHIQNVNNTHKRFRAFLKPYIGVSTKYLNNYVSLFVWIENHKKIQQTKLEEQLLDSVSSVATYTPQKILFDLPPIPVVA